MREKVIKKRGRKPKNATVERRVEKLLKGEVEVKRGPGRPALTYDKRPEHIKYIIDCAALGYSNTYILNLLKERFGETAQEVVSLSSIITYKKRYAHEVAKREKELRDELTSMLPSVRIRFLQRVIERSEEGIPVGVDKEGNVVLRPDNNSIIQATKELNAMMRELDAQRSLQEYEIREQKEVEEQKRFIREAMQNIKAKNPEKTELEILRGLAQQLANEEDENITEAFTQLHHEYEM